MARDLNKLREMLRHAAMLETAAMTRLRRAQTRYDKVYRTRVRIQEQINELEDQIARVVARLKG